MTKPGKDSVAASGGPPGTGVGAGDKTPADVPNAQQEKARKRRATSDGSSRAALMSTALELLERDGVLSGLNLSEVAKEVGVTPANVYHFFGSRQGLLREALRAVFRELAPTFVELGKIPWPERSQRLFRLVREEPRLRQLALLSLDGANDLVFPFLGEVRGVLERDTAEGHLAEDADAEVAHAMLLATMMGYAIFRESAATRLDMKLEELDDRAEAVLAKMARAFMPA